MRIRIGTRKSKLAILQTKLVIDQIKGIEPDAKTEIVMMTTKGDKDRQTPLYAMGSTGVFVKDIEQALLDRSIDMAIHSLKDVSSVMDERLMLLPFMVFEDKRDCLITKEHKTLDTLKSNAILATGSMRRMACIHRVRPDIQFVSIRGNVNTRLEKLQTENIDGLVLATAGLKRLHLESYIDEIFSPDVIVPACGQGTIAVQIRKEDYPLFETWVKPSIALQEVQIEREFLALCKAGCHYPVGCMATIKEKTVDVYACLGTTIEDTAFVHETYSVKELDQVAGKIYRKVGEKRR
ncbi:hydroxymethylbilane synthase [Faecalicoccus pleomorphus]|uniref:hydroxymethylbilane synthase n=1 Tax=Faecalicoccus pleomorphus TaxID=1323 RepID=UPI0026EF2CEB|nr:hydroxymethylbilane synthase [Faecalicoccus pleomorphus]